MGRKKEGGSQGCLSEGHREMIGGAERKDAASETDYQCNLCSNREENPLTLDRGSNLELRE